MSVPFFYVFILRVIEVSTTPNNIQLCEIANKAPTNARAPKGREWLIARVKSNATHTILERHTLCNHNVSVRLPVC